MDFFNQETGLNLTPIFNQYLKYKALPILEVNIDKKKRLSLKWNTEEPHFEMPIEVNINGKVNRIQVSNKWTKSTEKIKSDFGSKNFNSNKFLYQFSMQR
jgi:aminopeptidase N